MNTDLAVRHMAGLWGLDPDALPAPMLFPRIPPAGAARWPALVPARAGPARTADLGDYRDTFHKMSSALLGAGGPPPLPGHPGFSREATMESLKSENARLSQENVELRRKAESATKDGGSGNLL